MKILRYFQIKVLCTPALPGGNIWNLMVQIMIVLELINNVAKDVISQVPDICKTKISCSLALSCGKISNLLAHIMIVPELLNNFPEDTILSNWQDSETSASQKFHDHKRHLVAQS